MINKNIYYNMSKLLSYNALYNFVLGERGNGKTYQGKKRMLELWVKKRKQSMYVRRTVTEIDEIKDTLFNDIQKDYPNLEITVKGYQGFINGECFCYFVGLSTSSNKKSASYPDVDMIFFDEYIITKTGNKNYLQNEMILLHGLVDTVFRPPLRNPFVYLCANSVSYVNPFFSFFNIEPKPGDKFITLVQDGDVNVCVELTDTQDYREVKKKSRFAKMLEGTDYASYSIDNNVLEDTTDFIINKKPCGFNYFRGAFRVGNFIMGCWSEGAMDTGVWFGLSYDKNHNWKYTVYSNQNFEGWKNVKIDRNNYNIKYIKKCFLDGRAYFENQEIKKKFIEEINKYI